MDFKTEIEKMTGLKLEGEGKYYAPNKYSWDLLEEANNIGFYVTNNEEGNKLVVYHDTDKPLYFYVKIQNKTTFTLKKAKNMECMNIEKYCTVKKVFVTDCFGNTFDGENYTVCSGEKDTDGDAYDGIFYIETLCKTEQELKDYYERCKKDFEALDKYSGLDGKKLNYFALHYARQMAYDRFKYLHGSEKVSFDEWQLLEGSMKGGHMWTTDEEFKNGYQYDMNNMYAYCMNRSYFEFPMREGKYMTLKPTDKIKAYFGIFKLNITKYNKQLFKKTESQMYTTYDIETLDLIDAEYELVDEENNAYVYDPETLIRGDTFFNYMKDLYKLKLQGNQEVKTINSRTWGLLSEEKKCKIPLDQLNEKNSHLILTVDIFKNYAVISQDHQPCKFTTARIKTFLLSYAKKIFIGNILSKVVENHKIYKINTDGFITDCPPNKMAEIKTISNEIGHLKIEKEYKGKWKCKNVKVIVEVV